tara:strand:- start:1097 stop:1909 length:813 start_codon:yes stop_codon:yes gene_type:complete
MSFILAAGAVIGVVGGVMKMSAASKAKKEAAAAQKTAKKELDAKKKQYEALDTSNLNKNMENKMEDLTVNQKGMELQNQQGQQQRANIMDNMKGAAGGSGIAALAQQMANSGQMAAQKSGEMIGNQEQANQAKSAAEDARVQDSKIAGAKDSRTLQYNKTSNLMGMSAGEAEAAGAAKNAAAKAKGDAVAGIGSSVMGAASDRKLKKNISKIGESNSGLNIYSFEYKNPIHGAGLFQGVMSDEVPGEAVIMMDGYEAVDYSMVDVEFKNI